MSEMNDQSGTAVADWERRDAEHRPQIGGVVVREDDIEPVKGIRAIAILFRGMSVLLLVLMAMQVFFAITSTVPLSPGVVMAEAVRLVIFAGLLWVVGDLAVLWVKTHHDLRATRIVVARLEHLVRTVVEADGRFPSAGPASRADRDR